MDEQTNLDLSSQIAKFMDSTCPNEPYACYLAHNIKVGNETRVAVESPIIWKGATNADILAFYGAVIRAASTHAAQFIQSLPEEHRGFATAYLKEMSKSDMTYFGIDL